MKNNDGTIYWDGELMSQEDEDRFLSYNSGLTRAVEERQWERAAWMLREMICLYEKMKSVSLGGLACVEDHEREKQGASQGHSGLGGQQLAALLL